MRIAKHRYPVIASIELFVVCLALVVFGTPVRRRSDQSFVRQPLAGDALHSHLEPIPLLYFAVVEAEGLGVQISGRVERLD